MDPIEAIAERRIREAIELGKLENLPGAGKPLKLDDDSQVPPELRAAYRVLKNAGFLPPEVELRREIREAEDLLRSAIDVGVSDRAQRRLEYLRLRLSVAGRKDLRLQKDYYEAVCDRLEGGA